MNKIVTLEVFGHLIFESDALEFLSWCKDKKREWILTHTKQTDEKQITEFINNPNISKDCKCLDCGKNKVNDSSRITKQVAAVVEPTSFAGVDSKNNTKRPSAAKGRKD